jgi:outer membrane protein OmpA-like peptidoglycan-associated protein
MKKKLIVVLVIFLSSYSSIFAQEITPTIDKALINTLVTNDKKSPLAGEQVTFTSKKTSKSYKGVTNNEGKFSLLLPIGATYIIDYKNITQSIKFNELTIPSEPKLYTWDIDISFEPARVVVLENVEFDVNKYFIRTTSFKALNDLAEVMNFKPKMKIEIGGHTDNVGDEKSNELLSLNRANSIKQYLVKKGIKAERIVTKGYGKTEPIADNDSAEGRQKNRRTEVKILQE